MACKKCGKAKCACKGTKMNKGGVVKKAPVFKTCKTCPSPAKCKKAGKCMGKK
jgi:hypothetical protein